MKHGKRPTRAQKMRLQRYCLNPDNCHNFAYGKTALRAADIFRSLLIVKDCRDMFVIVNKVTGKTRTMKGSGVDED